MHVFVHTLAVTAAFSASFVPMLAAPIISIGRRQDIPTFSSSLSDFSDELLQAITAVDASTGLALQDPNSLPTVGTALRQLDVVFAGVLNGTTNATANQVQADAAIASAVAGTNNTALTNATSTGELAVGAASQEELQVIHDAAAAALKNVTANVTDTVSQAFLSAASSVLNAQATATAAASR
ncbi:unnamed protein product [Peniophora sp. CBMAI 1063]|nr:unnamed protein product [Peniophora sp. CBMAI 1063]